MKHPLLLTAALGATLAVAPACGDSVTALVADEEPIRFGYVIGSTTFEAQFFAGDLPKPDGGPKVAGIDIGPNRAAPGTRAKGGYVVRAEDTAYSIAIRLQGRTNGYWVARVGQAEALNGAQVSASIVFDVAPTVAPGSYRLEVSGVDSERHYGERALAPLQIVPRISPDAPAVITLRWDTATDLDLQVRAPDGTLLSPKRPTTAPVGAPDAGTLPGVGRLEGDSVASCVDDGLRQEDVIFLTPPAGKFSIFVNPFSLCGQVSAGYEVSVLRNGRVDQRFVGRIGQLEVQQGGFGLGDFIADVLF